MPFGSTWRIRSLLPEGSLLALWAHSANSRFLKFTEHSRLIGRSAWGRGQRAPGQSERAAPGRERLIAAHYVNEIAIAGPYGTLFHSAFDLPAKVDPADVLAVEDVVESFGILPEQVIDLRSLNPG